MYRDVGISDVTSVTVLDEARWMACRNVSLIHIVRRLRLLDLSADKWISTGRCDRSVSKIDSDKCTYTLRLEI